MAIFAKSDTLRKIESIKGRRLVVYKPSAFTYVLKSIRIECYSVGYIFRYVRQLAIEYPA